jgi:hypothetical protein
VVFPKSHYVPNSETCVSHYQEEGPQLDGVLFVRILIARSQNLFEFVLGDRLYFSVRNSARFQTYGRIFADPF